MNLRVKERKTRKPGSYGLRFLDNLADSFSWLQSARLVLNQMLICSARP